MVMRGCAIWSLAALMLGGGSLSSSPAAAAAEQVPSVIHVRNGDRIASETALQFWTWVIAARDNGNLPFIIIDKADASLMVLDAQGQLLGASPALIGVARGDDATPGIGDRELNEIGPAERTTPAGRFVARIGPAKGDQKVLWVDLNTSVALHPVATSNKKERRLERLQSPTSRDNRITFGCMNVPVSFYDDLVSPLFADRGGLVYILPEDKFLIEVFPAFGIFMPAEQGSSMGGR